MPNRPHTPLTLDRLPTRVQAVIRHINTQTAHGQALQRRLMELGFVPGEKVEVLRRMLLGKGPLAVRVGGSTFAMRPLESSLIEVVPA
jgi:ferrous iron transport protein A